MKLNELISIIKACEGIVEDIVADHNKAHPDDIRYGGFFCIGHRYRRTPIATIQICDIPDDEKAAKYYRVAQKKNQALLDGKPLIVSTYQVRDPEKEIWGGGIEVERYDFSFSGLTEHEDELAMITLGLQTGRLGVMSARFIADLSKNSVALDLIKAYQQSTEGLLK